MKESVNGAGCYFDDVLKESTVSSPSEGALVVSKDIPLNPLKLGMSLAVSVGNGEIMCTSQYVSDDLHLGKYRA